jgi:probable rRNA maturation factor
MPAHRVSISFTRGCRGRVPAGELRRIARHVLAAESVAPHVEVEVVLADADTVRDLNRLYRGRNEPTDVLSFSASDFEALEHAASADDEAIKVASAAVFVDAPDEAPSLGEVIVCLPVAEASVAGQPGHTLEGAVAHLLVHGLLHLIGHDHEEAPDAEAMQSREDELLAALGYSGRYAHGH